MQSIHGYYNGHEFVPLGTPLPKKNQKVIITILDEFVEPKNDTILRKYAGILDEDTANELLEAIEDCERIDADEW